jgi:hypothetical protein
MKNTSAYVGNALIFKAMSMVAGLFKFSFIMGWPHAFFSLGAAIAPLSGELAGNGGSMAFFALNLIVYFIVKGSFAWHYLSYFIPGLFAAFYWSNNSKIVRIVPAALCMFLFIIHPTGSEAAVYSLFWLIPIIVALVKKQTIFMRALGSTFTAHAVGSVIWLYTLNMSADQWIMLIPVVIFERLLLAISMVGMYHALHYAREQVLGIRSNPSTQPSLKLRRAGRAFSPELDEGSGRAEEKLIQPLVVSLSNPFERWFKKSNIV